MTRADPGGTSIQKRRGACRLSKRCKLQNFSKFRLKKYLHFKRNNKEISFNEINITVAVREPLSLVKKPTLTLFFIFFKVSLFSSLISFFFSYSVLLMLNY